MNHAKPMPITIHRTFRRRRNLALVATLASLTAVYGAFAASASAVQITELSLPSGAKPGYLTAGPDGNIWFTDNGTNEIGKSTLSGAVTEYGLGLTPKAGISGIAGGPDGNIWFTERTGHKLGRITPSGAITEISSGLSNSPDVYGITAGPGGAMWFTETFNARIGEVDPATGLIKELPVPSGVYTKIVQGPDGNLWFTNPSNATILRMTPTGTVTAFGPLPASDCASGAPTPCPYPESIAVGPDGNLWFDESRGNAIGRITPSGAISEYTNGLTHGARVADLVAGPEGNIWFTENAVNQIGRITPSGVVTEFGTGLSQNAQPFGIALGPDQNLWVGEPGVGKIARVIPDVPPIVMTGPPASASLRGATVTGTVRSRGVDAHYLFEYGPTTAYGKSTPAADNGAGDDVVSVSTHLSHLAGNRLYHYRIVASNGNGVSYGQDATFTTGQGSQVTVRPFEMYFSGYASGGGRLRLSKIVVIRLRRGETVSYRCGHCQGSPSHARSRARTTRVSFRGLKLVVTGRSALQVTVAGRDGSKRVRTYGFRTAHAEAKFEHEHCFVAGRRKPVPCPAKPARHKKKTKKKHAKAHHHGRAARAR